MSLFLINFYMVCFPAKDILSYGLTTLTGAPARNALIFSAVASMIRWRLSFGARGDVRRDDAVFRLQQRVVCANRLGVDHIQSRRGYFAAVERVGNVLLIDELAAGIVDENDAVLHFGDALLVDHAGVFRREIAVQRDNIRAGIKFIKADVLCDLAAGVVRKKIIGQHIHAERLGDAPLRLPDAAKADDTDRLAPPVR